MVLVGRYRGFITVREFIKVFVLNSVIELWFARLFSRHPYFS